MTEMFLERRFDEPMSSELLIERAIDAAGCFGLHRVDWIRSHLSTDGRKAVCCFQAPDMESARIAMHQSNIDAQVFWRGSTHDRPGLDEQTFATANVVVERQFERDMPLQDIQDIEDANIHCLEARNVTFLRTYYSADQQRMLCLYRAPDAESVRQAQREARVPFTDSWAFSMLTPDNIVHLSS